MGNTAYPEGVRLAGGTPGAAPVPKPLEHPGRPFNVDYLVSSSEPGTSPRTFNGLDGALEHARSLLAHSAFRHSTEDTRARALPVSVTLTETPHVDHPKPPPPAR